MFYQLSYRQVLQMVLAMLVMCVQSLTVNAQDNSGLDSVPAFVENWLASWEAQNTDAYFSSYHPDFTPDGYANVADWRESRIRNITQPDSIAIRAEVLDIVPGEPGFATVRFWFEYRSPTYADRTWKALDLAVTDKGSWAITGERDLEVQILPVNVEPEQAPEIELLQSPLPEPGSAEAETQPVQTTESVSGLDSDQGSAEGPVDDAEDSEEEEWVPPGFENLNQPQITEIDVYYGGFYLDSILAEFTLFNVTFLNKDKLADSVPNLKDPEAFRLQLNRTFDAHPELLCFSEFQQDCGVMETDSIDVIFDQARLRLMLFISPDLLLIASNDQLRFLPASGAGLSFLNQSAAFFSGQDSDFENYNLFNNTLFAWRENRLSMRSNLDSNEGFEIDTLAFMREFRGKDYRLGLMRENANGFSFMSNERFEGLAFGSSLLTRTDLEQSLGTEIELFFQTRSRVEIYQEGRLISTDYYNVGNNILDTSSLPNGSYTIEIRIIDASGNVTTEERYYSKTANIAPADQPLYFLQAGRLKNDLDINRLSVTGEDTFIRGGYNLRLTQSIGGSLGFSVVDDTSMVEAGLFKQGQNYEMQANAAHEDNGASGLDLRMRYRHPRYSLTVNSRQVFNGVQDSQIGLDYNQYYAMLEIPTAKGYLSLFHRDVERPQTGRNSNTGLRYRSRPKDFYSGTLNTNVELSKNGDEVIGLLTFSYQLQGNNRTSAWEPKLSYANEASSRDSGLYGSYQSSWYTGQRTGSEYRFTMRGDYDYQNSLEAQFESDTELGSSDIVTRYNGETRKVEYSGRLSTSYATNGATSAFGGKRRSESAFLVRVEGDPNSGARFQVLINGVVRGEMGAEETLMLPVSPYQTYEVELRSIGDTLVDLDNRVYQETLYPGNVVNLSWSTRVISIGIGRLVNENNEPLENAVLQNVIGIAVTDSNGFFQAEIDQDTKVLQVQRRNFKCEAPIERSLEDEIVVTLGTMVCR